MPFNYISSSFFIHSWYGGVATDEATHRAGEAMALPFLISAFLIPVLGLIIDKNGRRGYVMLVSSILALLTFVLFILIDPIYGLILFGISFAIFAAVLWPSITLVVPVKLVGLALGLGTSMQNMSMSTFPLIVAFIFNTSKSYTDTLLFFVFISIITIILAFVILYHDKFMDNILDRTDPENAIIFNKEADKSKDKNILVLFGAEDVINENKLNIAKEKVY